MDPIKPSCQICQRQPSSNLEFLCCACARGKIYNSRVHSIQAVVDKERLSSEVTNILASEKSLLKDSVADGEEADDSKAAARSLRFLRISTEKQQAEELAQSCRETCTEIKRDIKNLRAIVSQRRDELARRRTKVSLNKQAMSGPASKAVQIRQESASAIEADWAKLYSAICDDRVLLCREIASLYGLEAKKHRHSSGRKDVYLLGGAPVIDLRDLNTASSTAITVSATRVAHLIHLTSHYLSLQLPAQIDLPSANNPFTIIHSPSTSYKDPSLLLGRKNSTSSTKLSRQRILHLDKPLPQLASDDPVAYGLLVDALSLLAWDVAWLAKTQGIDIGAKHWDEVCAMGRNLWLMFASPVTARPPTGRRTSTSETNPYSQTVGSSPMARTASGSKRAHAQATLASEQTPRHSHDSSRAFLPAASAQGGAADVFRNWQFASYVRLIERIKTALANDRAGAEWEMLEKEEWAEAEAEDVAAAAAAAAQDSAKDDASTDQKTDEAGGKGWMRLRNRTANLL